MGQFVNQAQANYAGRAPIQQPVVQQPQYAYVQPQQGVLMNVAQPQIDSAAANRSRALTLLDQIINADVARGALNIGVAQKIASILQSDAYSGKWDMDLGNTFGPRICGSDELASWIHNKISLYANQLAAQGVEIRGIPQQVVVQPQNVVYPQQGVIQPQYGYAVQQPMMVQQPGVVQPQYNYAVQQPQNVVYPQQGMIQQTVAYPQGVVQPQNVVYPQQNAGRDAASANINYIYGDPAERTGSGALGNQVSATVNPVYNSQPAVATAAPLRPNEIQQPVPAQQANPNEDWKPGAPDIIEQSAEFIKKLFGSNNHAKVIHADKFYSLITHFKPKTATDKPTPAEINSADIVVDTPAESIAQVVADVMNNNKTAITVPAVHTITAQLEHVLHLPYDLASKQHDSIQIIINQKAESMSDANDDPIKYLEDVVALGRSVITALKTTAQTYCAEISNLVIDLFNQQYTNCVAYTDSEGYRHAPSQVDTLDELDSALDLSHKFQHEFKAKDPLQYLYAINRCLWASVFAIWSIPDKDKKALPSYLNPNDIQDLSLILSNSTTGIFIDGLPARAIKALDLSSEDSKKKIVAAAKNVFIVLYSANIVLSNIDLGIKSEIKSTADFKPKVLDDESPYAGPLEVTVGRKAYSYTVLLRDKSTFTTPYIASAGLGGKLTLRKVQLCTRQNCK